MTRNVAGRGHVTVVAVLVGPILWVSAAATVTDFGEALPGMAVILVLAVIVERAARPTHQRGS